MVRTWKPPKKTHTVRKSAPRKLIFLVQLGPSDLHPEAAVVAGGWACPHMMRRLGGPVRLWGVEGENWSIGPLRNWSASTPVADPVILCARCTKKRNGDGRDFTIGDYPKATPEQFEAYKLAIAAGPPPLESQSAKAGSK